MIKISALAITILVFVSLTVSYSSSTASPLVVPLPPDPLPAGFDWAPLARDYCSQLAARDREPANCQQIYLDAINTPVAASPPSGPIIIEDIIIETLVCEDSVEYQTNPLVCL